MNEYLGNQLPQERDFVNYPLQNIPSKFLFLEIFK